MNRREVTAACSAATGAAITKHSNQNFLPYMNGTGNLDSAVTMCVDQILSFGR